MDPIETSRSNVDRETQKNREKKKKFYYYYSPTEKERDRGSCKFEAVMYRIAKGKPNKKTLKKKRIKTRNF